MGTSTFFVAVSERGELTRQLLHTQLVDGPPEPGTVELLQTDESLELLASRQVGRLAYMARAGVPEIVPVNYLVVEGDVLIRSGPGPKLQAAERRELVVFEVDELDDIECTGWSVVVHGTAARLSPREQQMLSVHPEPWAGGPRSQVIRIRTRRITGRRLS